jgi:hypothetical protein
MEYRRARSTFNGRSFEGNAFKDGPHLVQAMILVALIDESAKILSCAGGQ